MAQELINIGQLPNDGTGDPLRVAFQKINNNFTQLFSTSAQVYEAYSVGTETGQVILLIPSSKFTQAKIQCNSINPSNQDSQNITITAMITNNRQDVKFTGYGTLFNGNALVRYDMDVSDGYVRLKVNPFGISDTTILSHFMSAQVTYDSDTTNGIPLQLDGYETGSYMSTENDLAITTENQSL
jgi:hypothetical protein